MRSNSFPFVLAPFRRSEGEISRETGSGGGKEGPREDRERESVDKGRQKITVQGRTQSAEEGSEKMSAEQRRESAEVRKTTAKTFWRTKAGLTNAKRWVSIPSGFVEVSRKIHARNSLKMHGELHKSVT